MNDIILASNSPRRKEILKNLGLSFKSISPNIDETIDENKSPASIVMELALKKAKYIHNKHKDNIVIGADTIVVCDGNILGKPLDNNDAFRMLNMLSGVCHEVFTGIAIIRNDIEICDSVKTVVRFKELDSDEIEKYIATGEPLDKAGGYGVQGKGGVFIEAIGGDYYNVVGLPVCKIYSILREKFDIDIMI